MRETRVSLPELALVALTRAALGFGFGLLASSRLTNDQRRAVGITMVLVGAVTTIPLAIAVLQGRQRTSNGHPSSARRSTVDEGLMAD